MPAIAPRISPPRHWPLQLAAASGRSCRDFFVLAYSSDYDEAFASSNPATFASPTSRFTHILHFSDTIRDRVYRIPDRLLDLWWSEQDFVAYAVGFPRSVFEVDIVSVRELPIKEHAGTFTGLWASSNEHVFACGFQPFLLYRHHRIWQRLTLPNDTTEHLHAVCGTSERDVYVVGAEGTILHFDGRAVTPLETPTTRNLLSIEHLSDGLFCVGGIDGTLLIGNRRGWRPVVTHVHNSLYTLAPFGGKMFFPGTDGLFVFDGKSPPHLERRVMVDRVAPLSDAILLEHGTDASIYDGNQLTQLDTVV